MAAEAHAACHWDKTVADSHFLSSLGTLSRLAVSQACGSGSACSCMRAAACELAPNLCIIAVAVARCLFSLLLPQCLGSSLLFLPWLPAQCLLMYSAHCWWPLVRWCCQYPYYTFCLCSTCSDNALRCVAALPMKLASALASARVCWLGKCEQLLASTCGACCWPRARSCAVMLKVSLD